MALSRLSLALMVPLSVSLAHAESLIADALELGHDPFTLDPGELAPIRFTHRRQQLEEIPSAPRVGALETHFLFELKPGLPDFSRAGGYGLGLFGQPRVAVQHSIKGENRLDQAITDLHDGFAYSAGVNIEHEEASSDGKAFVSSSLLGVSYGRLGRLWYGGVDVNLEQFSDEHHGEEFPDQLSFDLTTGRRLGFTGLSATSPLWLLSLQGNFDVLEDATGEHLEEHAEWYLNPSLFWQSPGFTFSAQMQLPVELEDQPEDQELDYRLRAIFEKRFK